MATKRKEKKKERPCGEGYKRVEIDPNEEAKSKNPDEKKYKCIKIRKPGIKKEDKYKVKTSEELQKEPPSRDDSYKEKG